MAYQTPVVNEEVFSTERDQKDRDIEKMVIAGTHLGGDNLQHCMSRYIYKRAANGMHLINLGKTYEKLMLAARIIVAIENPADVVVVAALQSGSRAILKFAHFTGAQALAGRWTPGTFTNQITKKYVYIYRLALCCYFLLLKAWLEVRIANFEFQFSQVYGAPPPDCSRRH